MSRIFTHSLAAIAAVVLAITSIGTIVTVPSATSQAPLALGTITELA